MASPTPFKDQTGKVIGYKTSDNTYLTPGGAVVAKVRNGTTYGAKSEVRGAGDQGLRLFGKK